MRYITLFLLFFCQSVWSQTAYHFSKLTAENGLSDSYVQAIGQDKYGFMWFATLGDISRYDGRNMAHFRHRPDDTTSILSGKAQCMNTDSSGRFFIGFTDGFAEFHFQTRSFRRVTSLKDKNVTSIVPVRKDLIFLSTTEGVAQFNPLTSEVIFLNNDALKHTIESGYYKNGQLYLTSDVGLLIYDIQTKKVRKITIPAIEKTHLKNVILDNEDNIWLTAKGKNRILRISANGTKTETYDQYLPYPDPNPKLGSCQITKDPKGGIWIAVKFNGLLQYDTVHNAFIQHVHDPQKSWSLSGDLQHAIFCSKEGIIWCGGDNVNFFHPHKTFFTTLLPFPTELETERQGLKPLTTETLNKANFSYAPSIAEDNDKNLWLGTRNGLVLYNTQTKKRRLWYNQGKKRALWDNLICDLYCDKANNIWIATASGLNRYNRQTDKIEFLGPKDSFPLELYISLRADNQDNLWISPRVSPLRYHNFSDKKTQSISQHNALKRFKDDAIWTLLHDSKNRYWFAFDDKGLGFYDPQTQETQFWRTDTEGGHFLAGNSIMDIKEDKKGIIWLSSFLGLTSFDYDKKTFKNYRHETLNGASFGLAIDSFNRIWVSTGHGLVLLDSSRTKFTQFGVHDGLPTLEFIKTYSYALSGDRIAMPTRNGFVIFNPNQYGMEKRRVNFYAASFSTKNDERPLLEDEGDLNLNINLASDENAFQIQLVALNYLNPNQTWFAYKLEGVDNDWRYTQDPKAVYTNVAGGNYTFRYKATADANDWDVPEKAIILHIDTVFYKSWWFWGVIFAGIAYTIFQFYRYRETQQKQVFDLLSKAQLLEKEKAVMQYEGLKQQLNPHFLFNSLTSLSSLIHIDPQIANDFLESLSKTYRYILKSSESETVLLKDEIKFAESFVMLQTTRFEGGLFVNFNVEEAALHLKIVPVTLQNMIENAMKHNIIDNETPLVIDIFTEKITKNTEGSLHGKETAQFLVIRNNLQKKNFVATSNKHGLINFAKLYQYLSNTPIEIIETDTYFAIKIPLLMN